MCTTLVWKLIDLLQPQECLSETSLRRVTKKDILKTRTLFHVSPAPPYSLRVSSPFPSRTQSIRSRVVWKTNLSYSANRPRLFVLGYKLLGYFTDLVVPGPLRTEKWFDFRLLTRTHGRLWTSKDDFLGTENVKKGRGHVGRRLLRSPESKRSLNWR